LVNVITQVTGYSFPSGHVMFYTSFFGFLFYLSYTLLKPSWKRSLLLLLFGGLIILVGPSRIYLGNHWASDVFAAYLVGSLILLGVIALYNHWSLKSRAEDGETAA
jgi:undecaprenyl-diphosphatase